MNIVLTGMMGSGKTSVGKEISRASGRAFIDTDAFIAEKHKTTIPRIFKEYGESCFRRLESEVISLCAAYKNTVIATGGGAVLNPENMIKLKQGGFVVYLKCSARELYARTLADSEPRPLLAKADPLAELEKILSLREALYAKFSDFTIETQGVEVVVSAKEILKRVSDEICSNKRP